MTAVHRLLAGLGRRVRAGLVGQHRTGKCATDDPVPTADDQLSERRCRRLGSHGQPHWTGNIRRLSKRRIPAEYLQQTNRTTSGGVRPV